MRGERELRLLIREELARLDEAELTVGDVKKALAYVKGKKAATVAKEIAKGSAKVGLTTGAKSIIGALPGGGTIASWFEGGVELANVVKDAWKDVSPEEKKKNPLWDRLTVDPDTSRIVDDEVEERFATELGNRISELPDDTPLPDADTQLGNWLKDRFNGAHVTKAT